MTAQLYQPDDRITCYVCNSVGSQALYISDAPSPYDWVCISCIKKSLVGSKTSEDGTTKCASYRCDEDAYYHYCEQHHDEVLQDERDAGAENATPSCYNCGDNTDYLYCESCAEDQYGRSPECDDCSRSADIHLCSEHSQTVTCSEYRCYTRVDLMDAKCDKHAVKPDTTTSNVAVSDDGSTLTTDGITVKWEV